MSDSPDVRRWLRDLKGRNVYEFTTGAFSLYPHWRYVETFRG